MRILFVHNAYQQRGGEDAVVEAEITLMRSAGHAVDALIVSNDRIAGRTAQARAAVNAIYSRWGYAEVARAIESFRPDVVHVHNFFPLLSPSVFDACHDLGVPSVWTLHNYRIACANGFLLRNGRPCEDCLGAMPFPAVVHRCYRGSTVGSATVAAMIGYHRLAGTWTSKVTRYIALTEFAKNKFIQASIPSDRISVKTNFSQFNQEKNLYENRNGFTFVGRLSKEKGILELLKIFEKNGMPVRIIGSGPLRSEVEKAAADCGNILYLGQKSSSEVLKEISRAMYLVVPSQWQEMFGLVAIEAMAAGTPVIASKLGALTEIILDGVTGHLADQGSITSLARCIEEACRVGETEWKLMSDRCRQEFIERYSPESTLSVAERIYREAINGYRGNAQ